MVCDDHVLYSDEFRPCELDPARRKLLHDFEQVRNKQTCSKWIAKRKYDAERHLTYMDQEVLKVRRYGPSECWLLSCVVCIAWLHPHLLSCLQDYCNEFTFYSVAVAACGLCLKQRQQFCEANDVWFWAERRQWFDHAAKRLCTLPSFLAGDLALESQTRWVGGQPVTVFYGSKHVINRAAKWVLGKMDAAEDMLLAFCPPYFVDLTTCGVSCH